MTLLDDDYPDSLKHIYRPPFVLFYYGDLSLVQDMKKIVGVIGAREHTDYGKTMTQIMVKEISKEMIVISGLAKGIDSLAHKVAIDNDGKTIAVLGTAIDNCYPKTNIDLYNKIKKDHLLISEYPPGATNIVNGFPDRNRLIAGLSSGLLIIEAKEHSGTSNTAMHTIGQGKIVCCVPERAGVDSLCNKLISQGATMVTSGKDVLYELNVIDR